MAFTVKTAVPEDEKRIRELFIEMLRTIYHTEDVEGYESGYLDKYWSDSEDRIYVAADSSVEAFLSVEVYREPETYIYLDDFSVTAACRNRGIGTKLIRLAEGYAESAGIPAIVLHVEKTNEGAHQLYGKLGYRDHEDQGNRILMVKDLG